MGIFSSVKATVPFNVLNHDPTVEVFLYICMYQIFLILSMYYILNLNVIVLTKNIFKIN